MNNMIETKDKDGMRFPSIDQLTHKSSSKYKLVIAVAKRAHEIDETGYRTGFQLNNRHLFNQQI